MVLTLSIFVSQKSLYSKKEPKSATGRLNKLKKRVLKNFLDEILIYRSVGPLSVPATGTKKLNFTGTTTRGEGEGEGEYKNESMKELNEYIRMNVSLIRAKDV